MSPVQPVNANPDRDVSEVVGAVQEDRTTAVLLHTNRTRQVLRRPRIAFGEAVKRKKKNKKKEVRNTQVPNCRCKRCQAFAAGDVPKQRHRPTNPEDFARYLERILRRAWKNRPRVCDFEERAAGEEYTWKDEKALFPCEYSDGIVPKPWQHYGHADLVSLCDMKVGATLEAWRDESRLTEGTRTTAGNSWAKSNNNQNPFVDSESHKSDREDLTREQLPHVDLSIHNVLSNLNADPYVLAMVNWREEITCEQRVSEVVLALRDVVKNTRRGYQYNDTLTHKEVKALYRALPCDVRPDFSTKEVQMPALGQPTLDTNEDDDKFCLVYDANGKVCDIVRRKPNKALRDWMDERLPRTEEERKEQVAAARKEAAADEDEIAEWYKRVPVEDNRPVKAVADSTLEHRRLFNGMTDSELAFAIAYVVARDVVQHKELFNDLTAEQLAKYKDEYVSRNLAKLEKRERMKETAARYAEELLTVARPEGVRQVDTTDAQVAALRGVSARTAQRWRTDLASACRPLTLVKLWQRIEKRNPEHKLLKAWRWSIAMNFASLEPKASMEMSPAERLAIIGSEI
jgi:hypothetical protein